VHHSQPNSVGTHFKNTPESYFGRDDLVCCLARFSNMRSMSSSSRGRPRRRFVAGIGSKFTGRDTRAVGIVDDCLTSLLCLGISFNDLFSSFEVRVERTHRGGVNAETASSNRANRYGMRAHLGVYVGKRMSRCRRLLLESQFPV
jgi:hypothetical protein